MRHLLQAASPSAEDIISNTSKAYRRRHPAGAATKMVPDIHRMLDGIKQIPPDQDEKAIRTHLILLLLLAGGRRASDYVRVYRNARSLKFDIVQADVPAWAAVHRSRAGEMLKTLGLIDRDDLKHNELIRVHLRAYLGKTSLTSGRRYDPWHTLHENTFDLKLCPVLAVARYLQLTANKPVTAKDGGPLPQITNDRGTAPTTAAPLLLSLTKPNRHPLKSNTISGIVRRTLLSPQGIPDRPHVVRATVASYKHAYGVEMPHVRAIGNWSSDTTFFRHYFRVTDTPVHPARLSDVQFHDWVIPRAHALSKQSLAPLDPRDRPDTSNDEAIAQVMRVTARQRQHLTRRRRLRRGSSSYS